MKEPAPEALLLSVKPDHIVVKLRFYIEDFSKGDNLSGLVMEACLADLAKMGVVPAIPTAVPAGKE